MLMMIRLFTQRLFATFFVVASLQCLGQGLEPPYLNSFDTEEDFNKLKVIDASGDGKTWNYSTYYGYEHSAVALSSRTEPKDDWIVSPAVSLKAGRSYLFSFLTCCGLPNYSERLEAYCGAAATVDGQSTKLIEPTIVNWDVENWQTLSATFTPDADGDYYFSIHAISDVFMQNLYIDDFSVKEVNLNSPAAVTGLTAIADRCQLPVSISFIAPTLNAKGETITSISRISIKREDTLIKEFVAPRPGETLFYDDMEAKEGTNHYYLSVENEYGEGPVNSVSCYVGNDMQPLAVTNIKATDNGDGTIKLTWDAPTTGLSGGYVDPASVKYRVMRNCGSDYLEIAKDINDTQVIDATEVSGQACVKYIIYDYIDSPYDYQVASAWTMAGTPYTMPFKESCNDGLMEMQPWELQNYSSNTSGGWFSIYDKDVPVQAYDEDGGYLVFIPVSESDSAMIASPKIAIKGTVNPTLSFSYYSHKGCTSRLHVGLAADGDSFADIFEVSIDAEESGWKRMELPLNDYSNCNYVRFAFIGAAAGSLDYIRVDNIVVNSQQEQDLALTKVVWPEEISKGGNNIISVNVTNNGTKQAGNFSVLLYRDFAIFANKNYDSLAPGETIDVEFTDDAATITSPSAYYMVIVDYVDDFEKSNNYSDDIEINVNQHWDYPIVKDANAIISDGKVQLTWEIPDAYQSTFESFENSYDFAISGISPWTVRDFNRHSTITVGNGYYDNAGLPAAFMVFNPELAGVDDSAFTPHSGKKMLAAFANTWGLNDGWLISPELSGKAQNISFYAKSANIDFPEYMEVWYSTASRTQDDFTEMVDGFDLEESDWAKVNFELPEGVRYFAIRCNSYDAYALLIDDITYQSATANAKVVGYNIYRNGERLNDSPVTDLKFTDNNAPSEECKYGISAVYTTGESQQAEVAPATGGIIVPSLPIEQCVSVSGNRLVVGVETADIYNVGGMHVAHIGKNSDHTIILPSGIYIVKFNGSAIKVAVK